MWKVSLLSSLLFLPFGMGVSILCLSHHCIFEAYNFGDLLQKLFRKFPGSLVVKTLGFHFCDPGSIPDQGTEILQATQSGQEKLIQKYPYIIER